MPIIRILLLPFAVLYKWITDFRNHLYDIGSRKSIEFDRFVIGVGNLTVGGTGKTPFVELLIRELMDKYHLAVLSRGYKRKTRGFRLASNHDDANSLGDEPFQYFTKFGRKIKVAVGEERALAIPELIFQDEKISVIILDDAYQHRAVKPHMNILLADYHRPFYQDHVLPAGLLRESRKHADRADVVVVTKCPNELSHEEIDDIKNHVIRYTKTKASVYFSGIKYLKPQRLFGNQSFSEDVLLFSGIANASLLEEYVDKNFNLLGHKKYPDHYSFTKKDLTELIGSFEEINSQSKCLLTTEKDMVRLISMKDEAGFLQDYPVFYLPIELYFLENGDFFTKYLTESVVMGLKDMELN